MKRKQTPPAGDKADSNDFPSIAAPFPGEWEKTQADRRAAAAAERKWRNACHETSLASRGIPDVEWRRIIDTAIVESGGDVAVENAVVMREAERWLHPPDTRWSKPDSPKQWGRIFGFSADTFIRRCTAGKIRHIKHNCKSYSVCLDDLPASAKPEATRQK